MNIWSILCGLNILFLFGTVYITCISDEAMCVGKVIDMLLDADVVESCIGVITPYNEQRKVIKWCLPKGTKKEVNQCMMSSTTTK